MTVPLPLKSQHCSSLSGGTNTFFFSDNDSLHIWQLETKRSQGEFKLFPLPPFPIPPHLQKGEHPTARSTIRTRESGSCNSENIVHFCPFFHMKIPTEAFHCQWKPETNPSAGDKNTGEQLLNLERWPGHSQGNLLCLEHGDPCRWNLYTIPAHCHWCH